MAEFLSGLQIRLAGLGGAPGAIVHRPAPILPGEPARGRAMLRGIYRLAGQELTAPGYGPWKLTPPSRAFADALHGFDWLDDFMLIPGAEPRREVRSWIYGWIAKFGEGEGEGWSAGVAGRRLCAWAAGAPLALDGADPELSKRFFRAAGRQLRYLSAAWKKEEDPAARLWALAGLVWGGLAFDTARAELPRHLEALSVAADRMVGADGGISSRNPEALAEMHLLLAHATAELEGIGHPVPPALRAALDRMAPALRMLRLGDGRLAPFHGGGVGPEGRIDSALRLAKAPRTGSARAAMGFVRMQGGRSAVLVDAAPPPATAAAHASTLAVELCSGARRILVGAGPGAAFGRDWAEACRATAAHSALTIGRSSSSRYAPRVKGPGPHLFAETPAGVSLEQATDIDGEWLLGAHDGYLGSHGAIHRRRLFLSLDGRDFRGEDVVESPQERKARARFDKAAAGLGGRELPFALRFHLHPDCRLDLTELEAEIRHGDELWRFHADGGEIAAEDSVWFSPRRSEPIPCKQIVVTARTEGYWGRVAWAFRRETG